jgi:SMP-30/Gluconolactonase/LRE-like region
LSERRIRAMMRGKDKRSQQTEGSGAMTKSIVLSVIGACLSLFALCGPASAAEASNCAGEGNLKFVCGPQAVEDMVDIPGTEWILGSGMTAGDKPGSLHLIDVKTKAWEVLYPSKDAKSALDKSDYFRCPGEPDPAKFGAHGIALKQTGPDKFEALAVNHGGRESIEVFTIETGMAKPAITWIGCVVMPKEVWVNSVAFLPEGGFAVTRFYDPASPKGMASIFDGKPTGGAYEWHTQLGVTEVPGTSVAGANGIAVTPDGKWLFLAAWGSEQVVRFSRGAATPKKDVVDLGFSPDNLRWAPDGSLIAAGQNGSIKQGGGVPNFKGWTVVTIDPETLKVTEIARGAPDSAFQGVSSAIEVDGDLWLGIYRGDRVGYMPMR